MEKWQLLRQRIVSFLLVILGNVILALSVKLFIIPGNLVSGGTTGISMVVAHFTPIPMSVFILLFNVAMLILGWMVLGRQFAMSTIFSSLFYPVALELLNQTLGDVLLTDSTLLNAVFAGIGVGVSVGMVIRAGAATGGMDIPPLILERLFRIPVSAGLWAFDFTILLTQLLFHDVEDLLYGILMSLMTSVALNKVMLLGTSRTEVKIVSEKSDEIRHGILSQVDRGVTLLHGQGGYLQKDTEVLLSVVSNYELPKIQHLARQIDPDCFMIISQVSEVWGRGFSYGKRHPAPDTDKK